jgi:hypothetical protein
MSAHETLLLHPDRPLRLDAARHAELCVVSGIVWITVQTSLRATCSSPPANAIECRGTGWFWSKRCGGMAEIRLVACRRRWIPDLLESWRAMLPKSLATH